MAFVKLDTQILNSTIWQDSDACRVFITALLMAEPFEVLTPIESINTYNTETSAFVVPAGWYGIIRAAGPGIVYRAKIESEPGMEALERLASPDLGSRTTAFEGRRMVRIDGGYLVLNYITHRDRDHSNAERQARFRQREKERKVKVTPLPVNSNTVKVTTVTHAYVDVDVDEKKDQKITPSAEKKVTFSKFMESIPDDHDAIPKDHHVFNYSDKVGIPRDFLNLQWIYFERYYGAGNGKSKKYTDWPGHFRTAVENNYGKIWAIAHDGGYYLTTSGKQLQLEVSNER
jgi:hypothetical protein